MPAPALLSGSKDDLCVMITSHFNSYWSAAFWDVNWWLQSAAGSFGRKAKQEARGIPYHCSRQTPVKRAVTTVCLLLRFESSAVAVAAAAIPRARASAPGVIYADQKQEGKGLCAGRSWFLITLGNARCFLGYCGVCERLIRMAEPVGLKGQCVMLHC